jgi:AraC-like DNA-binding protein
MMSREFSSNNSVSPATLRDMFTPEELSRLCALRENFYTHAEYLERVIDGRRLEFARWLLENGKLSEGTDES